MRFVYPNSLLNPRAVDEFFADEAAAIDGPRVALWDASEGRLLDRRLPIAGETLVYRGWILARDGYARLADEITAAGATTFVSAEQYARAQFLDGWIDTMDGLTPRSFIASLGASTRDLVAQVATELEGKRFVVKGLSKSAKDAWDDAMFIRDVTDLPRVVDNLRPLLGGGRDRASDSRVRPTVARRTPGVVGQRALRRGEKPPAEPGRRARHHGGFRVP